MSKITKATIKSFVRKNAGKLFISNLRSFDGMIDGCRESDDKSFRPCKPTDKWISHTLGVDEGVWLVNGSRDGFCEYDTEEMFGYKVYNCCGSFILAVRKETVC